MILTLKAWTAVLIKALLSHPQLINKSLAERKKGGQASSFGRELKLAQRRAKLQRKESRTEQGDGLLSDPLMQNNITGLL